MPLELYRDRLVYMPDDIGGAGVCDGIVPLRAFTQFICSH